MKITHIIVNIFEGERTKGGEVRFDSFPILTHTFNGVNLKEAQAIEEAHIETDTFYRAAIEEGEWDGIPLKYTYDVLRREM